LRKRLVNKSGMENNRVAHSLEGGGQEQSITFLPSAAREGVVEDVDGCFSRIHEAEQKMAQGAEI
jgi:hypothetical protein